MITLQHHKLLLQKLNNREDTFSERGRMSETFSRQTQPRGFQDVAPRPENLSEMQFLGLSQILSLTSQFNKGQTSVQTEGAGVRGSG